MILTMSGLKLVSLVAIPLFYLNYSHGISETIGFETFLQSEESEYFNYSCLVEGKLPFWLSGILIRNGPGSFEIGDTEFTHLFDGFSKLHSFRFEKGQSSITFNSRFLRSSSYTQSKEANKIMPYVYVADTLPPLSFTEKMEALFRGVDIPNIDVFSFQNDTVALGASWNSYKFNKETLENVIPISASVTGIPNFYPQYLPYMATPHPIKEYKSDSVINIVLTEKIVPFVSGTTNVVRICSLNKVELVASIEVERPSLMHAFAMTKHYAILFADPYFLDKTKIVTSSVLADSWYHQQGMDTNIYVVHLETGNITKFHTKSLFHMHHANSFEKNGAIYIDYVAYGTNIFNYLKLNDFRKAISRRNIPTARIVRYKINISKGTLQKESYPNENKISSNIDFPSINENYRFLEYCFIYALIFKADGKDFAATSLVKKDMCSGKDKFWYQQSHYPSEPVFVPNPEQIFEDHGVVLSVVFDGVAEKSYLIVLDARSMTPLAKSFTPAVVPYTFHGKFFPLKPSFSNIGTCHDLKLESLTCNCCVKI